MIIRRITAVAIIVAAAVFASFFGGASRTLFYITLFIPLFSLLYTVYVYKRFKIYQEIENKIIVKGEKTPYYFVLSNEDFIAYTDVCVEFFDDFSSIQNIDSCRSYYLIPGEKNEHRTEILCRYRGEYKVGVKKIIVTDMLGLTKIRYQSPYTLNISVLPKIKNVEKLSLSPLDEDSKLLRFSHMSSMEPPDCETRKYVYGDSIKLINWKVSAKRRELYVRQSSDSQDSSIIFIMDMTPIDADEYTRIVTEDKIIESALTTANFLVKKNVPVSVVYEDDKFIHDRINSPEQFKEFYGKCAGMKFCGAHSPAELCRMLPGSTMSGFVIFAISSLTVQICEICENIIQLGGDAAIILIGRNGEELSEALDKRVIFKKIELSDEVPDILGGADEN